MARLYNRACCISVEAMPDKTFNHFWFRQVQGNGIFELKNLVSRVKNSPTPNTI
ncbi:MAG: hypothetical protein F6J96_12145 [Symploca sp. SIO1C2]|nr:hypothetical protein [Symploca sp. SIO1C2]